MSNPNPITEKDFFFVWLLWILIRTAAFIARAIPAQNVSLKNTCRHIEFSLDLIEGTLYEQYGQWFVEKSPPVGSTYASLLRTLLGNIPNSADIKE